VIRTYACVAAPVRFPRIPASFADSRATQYLRAESAGNSVKAFYGTVQRPAAREEERRKDDDGGRVGQDRIC
jgi:hypothetical protein